MNDTCLACGLSPLEKILDFGPQPAANLLSAEPGEPVRRELLALQYCTDCGHTQQATFYPPEELFGHYLYQSGTSGLLRDYFDWLAKGIAATSAGQPLLELASNDGSFLDALARQNIEAEGIEPAANLAKLSNERGLKATCGFWPDAKPERKFGRVVAMNVLAHTPNPEAFLAAVHDTLTGDGVALMQVSQVDMFDNFEFDTLYHEHYSFFSPSSIWRLAQRVGFSAGRFIKTAIHGGSMIAILGNNQQSVDAVWGGLQSPPFHLGSLDAARRPTDEQARAFGDYARATCTTVSGIAEMARETNRAVVLVGAAAKAVTVLQASGLRPDYIVDEAPLKIGRYLPGTDLRIDSLESVKGIQAPCLFIIGAWNFADELRRKLRQFRDADDTTAVYFPRFFLAPL